MIDIILTVGYTALMLMTIAIVGLYCIQKRQIEALDKGLRMVNSDNDRLRREIRILKERAARESDKIVIVHEPDNTTAPDYGHF